MGLKKVANSYNNFQNQSRSFVGNISYWTSVVIRLVSCTVSNILSFISLNVKEGCDLFKFANNAKWDVSMVT